MFCSECGKEISDKARMCPECGCPVEDKSNGRNGKNTGDAVASFLIVGLGQMLQGRVGRGLGMLVLAMFLAFISFPIGGLFALPVLVWSIVDAYKFKG